MRIDLKTKNIEEQVRAAIRRKMHKIFTVSEDLFRINAELLRDQFRESSSFNRLKTDLVGPFGFTPEEVADLDRILTLLVPDKSHDITITKAIYGKEYSIFLEWVDFKKLSEHPFAKHDLTKLDESGDVIGLTDTISWVEWLENGVSVIGYYFSKIPNNTGKSRSVANRSRSGAGLMKRKGGGAWAFQPTKIFEGTAKLENGDFLKKGFGLVARSLI